LRVGRFGYGWQGASVLTLVTSNLFVPDISIIGTKP
jgi:hypothetical protein